MSNLYGKFNYIPITILIVAAVLVWYVVFVDLSRDKLRVVFLDVGQGDSIFVESPSGGQMLIDGGPDNSVLRSLSREMPFYDRSIDILLATHPDADHIGGLTAVMERYEVDKIITPGVPSGSESYDFFVKAIKKEGAEKILAGRELEIDIGGGVNLEILFPDRSLAEREIDANAASIISMLHYGETNFLLTGDAPKSVEKYLAIMEGGELECDVLKAGHHGSDTSSSKLLLGFSSPEYAIISAGEDNPFGHPHKEVLERLDLFGIDVLKTSELGNIEVISDGREVEIINN